MVASPTGRAQPGTGRGSRPERPDAAQRQECRTDLILEMCSEGGGQELSLQNSKFYSCSEFSKV